MNIPIRILSLGLELIGEVDTYTSLVFSQSWHGIGEISITINRYMQFAEELQMDRILMIGNDPNKAYVIKYREISLDQTGKASENWIIKGLELKCIMQDKLLIPVAGQNQFRTTGTASQIMNYYVTNTLITPTNGDTDRAINQLDLPNFTYPGDTIIDTARLNVLAEKLTSLSVFSGLGWTVILDLPRKKWIFKPLNGVDRRASQNVNSRVIFSPDYNSLQTLQYNQNDLNHKNFAYVAGQGEGKDRQIIQVNNGAGTGYFRKEILIDARDIANTDENDIPIPPEQVIKALTDRGLEKLSEHKQETYLDGNVLAISPFKLGKDYNLGDIVTVQNLGWGVTLDARITKIEQAYENNSHRIDITFDNQKPTLVSLMKREFNNVNVEVRR